MQRQQEIEREVDARWESAEAQQPWAAHAVPAVAVDSWGQFPFILARVTDRSSGLKPRQKILLRGRNGLDDGRMLRTLEQELTQAAMQQRLPGARVELVGSGLMQWSTSRDRCLNIMATTLHVAVDARLQSAEDVGRIAGAMAQTGLPPMHTVKVNGNKIAVN